MRRSVGKSKIKKENKIKKGLKRIINFIKIYFSLIRYITLLSALSIYIFINWDKCISMKLFEQFDGNNILFLVWLVTLILQFLDIEAKDFKLRIKIQRDFDNVTSAYTQSRENNKGTYTNYQNSKKNGERSDKLEPSNQTVDN